MIQAGMGMRKRGTLARLGGGRESFWRKQIPEPSVGKM